MADFYVFIFFLHSLPRHGTVGGSHSERTLRSSVRAQSVMSTSAVHVLVVQLYGSSLQWEVEVLQQTQDVALMHFI